MAEFSFRDRSSEADEEGVSSPPRRIYGDGGHGRAQGKAAKLYREGLSCLQMAAAIKAVCGVWVVVVDRHLSDDMGTRWKRWKNILRQGMFSLQEKRVTRNLRYYNDAGIP